MFATRTTARLVAGLLGAACLAADAAGPEPPTRHRQPVALAGSPDGGLALRRQPAEREPSRSSTPGRAGRGRGRARPGAGRPRRPARRPSPPGRRPGRRRPGRPQGRGGRGRRRVEAGGRPRPGRPSPVAPDGSGAVVASTGSRRLSVVGWSAAGGDGPIAAEVRRSVDLPFAPRLMAWAGSKLVVADAFGGRIAVVDPASGRVESSRSIPGHNIRGLAASPDGRSLVVAHQTLNRLARSSFEDIHWGTLLNNHLRLLRLDAVLDPGPTPTCSRGSRLIELGADRPRRRRPRRDGLRPRRPAGRRRPLRGRRGRPRAGDLASTSGGSPWAGRPSAVLPAPGRVGRLRRRRLRRRDLGRRGRAVRQASGSIPLGPRPELGPVERGERLFLDARLSHDGWMSCQSCHTDGQTNGLLADTLGDGGFGAPKRVTSLLGVGATGPWTWTGVGRPPGGPGPQVDRDLDAGPDRRPPGRSTT